MHRSVGTVLLVGLLVAGTSMGRGSAQAFDDEVSAVRGVGALSCAQYIEMVEAERSELAMVYGWVDGFVTGLNAVSPDVFDHLPWQGTDLTLQLLANHCAANPTDVLAGALASFIQVTRATRLGRPSDVVEIPASDGQGPLEIYKDSLAQAQRILAERGHYSAAVDGLYGPGTAAAFRAFQAEHGLPENGLPDQRTLLMLFAPTFEGVE